jgi:hypothetical protein
MSQVLARAKVAIIAPCDDGYFNTDTTTDHPAVIKPPSSMDIRENPWMTADRTCSCDICNLA